MRVLLDDVTQDLRRPRGGAVEALAGVTFTVEDEELVAVVGPSGCGKSTLLNMLAGLLSPSAGSIAFEGELPAGRPPTAMVFQEFALFRGARCRRTSSSVSRSAGCRPPSAVPSRGASSS
jgi:ABC-type sugar transport system ATPase subunit